ncbi:MAG: carboxylating nicotinate-nucleotide diphosphorylase [Gemmatimonadetes bacterium]|nr:carboxylating nicotinate-nucleotide diphosphorylase [Gemmatimonadota bacterium]
MNLDAVLDRLIDAALAEDMGDGDRTTMWTVPPERQARALVMAKGAAVLAGVEAARRTFQRLDARVRFEGGRRDGDRVAPGDAILGVVGSAHAILTGERTALNFLAHLSGIALLTWRFVDAVAGTGARVTDTRKTTPGWRLLEKAAVRAGGGENHRSGLYDMVLVKENHIAAAGGIAVAMERVRAANRERLAVEVEVRTLAELGEAMRFEPDRILLDHWDLDGLREAVKRIRALRGRRPELEASGNVTLDAVRSIAETGVDLISVGALTHSAPAADFSLLVNG